MSSFGVARLFAAASLVSAVGVLVALWIGEPWRVVVAYVTFAALIAMASRMDAQRVRRAARRRRVYRVVADRMSSAALGSSQNATGADLSRFDGEKVSVVDLAGERASRRGEALA